MTGGIVVVLGKTKKNFAVGMSGGVAYVFDKEGTFKSTCNLGLVDLDPVEEEEDVMTLRAMIQQHQRHTRSKLANEVLADFDALLPSFIKVFPRDYKRVLKEIKAKELADQIKPTPLKVEKVENFFEKVVEVVANGTPNGKLLVTEKAPSTSRPTEVSHSIKHGGFVKYDQKPLPYRPAEERMKDWGRFCLRQPGWPCEDAIRPVHGVRHAILQLGQDWLPLSQQGAGVE